MFKENGSLHQVTRGGQVTLNMFRMYGQILKVLALIFLVTLALINVGSFFTLNTKLERAVFYHNLEAKFDYFLNEKSIIDVSDLYGRKYKVYAKSYLSEQDLSATAGAVWTRVQTAFIFSIIGSFIVFAIANFYLKRKGRKSLEEKNINKHHLSDIKSVNRQLKKDKKLSDLSVGGLSLVKYSETRHILNIGTTGSGKSNLIKSLLQQIIARGDKFIVFDKSCDLTHCFYDEQSSVILNPLDKRCAGWNIWSDVRVQTDLDAIARALIPSPNNQDPFFVNAARVVFSCAAFEMRNDKDRSSIKLLKQLLTADLENIHEYLKNTEAATLVDKAIEKTALSIKSEMAAYLSCLKYLNDGGEEFSIRNFVTGESDKQGLFITSLADKHHMLRPLITMWLDLAINATMSLAPDRDRRIWIILDEAHSLQELPILFEGANELRKFGGCLVIGTTSYAGLVKIYGHHGTQAIREQFNTSFYFTSPGYEGAVWASKELGESEVEEVQESYSYGANTMRDGVNLNRRRLRRPVVTPTDIDRLQDLEAYAKLPGGYPIAKVKFDLIKTGGFEPGFIERAIQSNLLEELEGIENSLQKTTSQRKEEVNKEENENEHTHQFW